MNQSKKKHSKAKIDRDDNTSSDEVDKKPKHGGKHNLGKSKNKKISKRENVKKEIESKGSKTSLSDNKYTDIKLGAYSCTDSAPTDAHTVTIDTYGICCQLWEMYKSKSLHKSNVTQRKQELNAILCSSLAILENIVFGIRYSDIPTMIVDSFPRTRVCVRNDYIEAVHACSIPKGKVYIGRGNKSVGYLTAFIFTIYSVVKSNNNESLETLETTIVNLLTNKGFNTPIIMPRDGEDTCLQQMIQMHNGTKYAAENIVRDLRDVMLYANTTIIDDPDYQLYVPVICEQSEVCYIQNFMGDVQLVSFMPIVQENTLKRLRMYAMSFRFYVSFIRVWKESKSLIDAEEVENEMLDRGYLPIFEKHGIIVLKRKMNEVVEDEEASVIVEETSSVPQGVISTGPISVKDFNFNNFKCREAFFKLGKCITLDEARTLKGRRVCISNDGIIALETENGLGFTMLSSKHRSASIPLKDVWFGKVPDHNSRRWSDWKSAEDGNVVASWVDSLPKLPRDW